MVIKVSSFTTFTYVSKREKMGKFHLGCFYTYLPKATLKTHFALFDLLRYLYWNMQFKLFKPITNLSNPNHRAIQFWSMIQYNFAKKNHWSCTFYMNKENKWRNQLNLYFSVYKVKTIFPTPIASHKNIKIKSHTQFYARYMTTSARFGKQNFESPSPA